MRPLFRLTLCLTLLLTACTNLPGSTPDGPQIVYGLTLMPSGFDPHLNASSELGIPLRSVYDTLVYRDPANGEVVPGLATRWELSPDGLSYTFYLREDVHFQDSTPFNAQAVIANLDRITNPDNGSQKARFMLGPLASYELVDANTVRLTFTQPYAALLDALSQVYLGIASPAALAEHDLATYQFHQVGTGPYRMVEYVPGNRLVLERWPDYAWGPSFYVQPANPIQRVEFRFYEDPPTRVLALESGEAQVMGEIQPIDAQLVAGNPDLRLYPVAIPGQPLQFMLNTKRFPTDNQAVRQALLYATNRAAIIDTVFQRQSPVATGPLSAVTDSSFPDLATYYPHDVAQAENLLTAAGFTATNADGTLILPTAPEVPPTAEALTPTLSESVPTGIPLDVIIVVPGWGMIPQVAQLLQSQWAELGIGVELRQVASLAQLQDVVDSGEYNLIAFYSFGRDPALLNQYFMSSGSFNWTGYDDPELDVFLEEAARQPDPAQRSTFYVAAQVRIMEQALLLPIRDYVNLNGATADLQGVAFDAQGWFPLLYNFSWAPQNGN
jgi:peptide/nickel transport system substrate-binding protein